jgi:class 3 adenylate cyclase/tetratricopeptide (TPR) repeat protein
MSSDLPEPEVGGRDLTRYSPALLRAWPEGKQWITATGTLCFADISGFTALSEKLAERGRIGAEELASILDRVFGEMLEVAHARGGSLLKFGGDALLLFFTGVDHATQAASAAVEMRTVLAGVRGTRSSAGTLSLRMSQGLHSGEVMMVRAEGSHSELVVIGPSVSRTMEMEHAANPGEILVSSDTRDLLPPGACGQASGDGWLLRWRTPKTPKPVDIHDPKFQPGAGRFVPVGLRSALSVIDPDPEHRVASVVFVKLGGTDRLLAKAGPDVVAAEIDRIIAAVTEYVDGEGITFLASDADADGFKLILVSGVPRSLENEEGRVLRAASRIAEITSDLVVKVGVNRGHVFAGEVGNEKRATYTIIGDTVNTAARMMAAAPACVVYAGPDVVERSRTLFETSMPEPIMVKGKSEPLRVLAVGIEMGDRGQEDVRGGTYVGRTREVESLRDAVTEAKEGRGGWVRIVGPTGFGKTRLMQEAIGDTEAARLDARAEPYGATNPYRPLRDPLRELLGIERGSNQQMADTLLAMLADQAPHLVPYSPLIGDVTHIETPSTPEADRITRRFRQERTADITIELLDAVVDRTLIITFDDSHWADPATAGLLDRLAAAASTRRWFGVETKREQDGTAGAVIDLEPLDEVQIRELIHARTAAAPLRDDVVDALVERSGGSPLFVEELLDALRATGGVDELPTSLEGVVGTQIDALDPLARRVLRYVSVLGRSFRTSVARDLIATEGVELNAATRTALAEFLVSDGDDRLRFYHAMVRDVAYSGLSFRQRRELHGRAGDLVLAGAADVDAVVDILAFHFYHSGDADRAWEFCVRAGDRNMSLYANPEAAVHFERAVEVSKHVQAASVDEIRDVYVRLGDVLERAGAFDRSIAAYRRASRLVSDNPLVEADMRLKMARARERAGKYSAALGDTTRAINLVEGSRSMGALRRKAEALGYAALVRQAQQKPQMALHRAEEAAAAAQKSGDDVTLARAWVVLDWALFLVGRSSEAVYSRDALEIYERLNDLNQVAIVATNLGGFAFFDGDWDLAVLYYEKGRDAADEAGNKIHAANAAANIGEVFVYQGRVAEAIGPLEDARRTYQASGFTEGLVFVDLLLAKAYALLGDLDTARAIAEASRDAASQLGLDGWRFEASIHLAEIDALCGNPAAALADLTAARGGAPEVYRDHYGLVYSRVEATVLGASGDVDGALAILDAAIRTATERGDQFEHTLLVLTRHHIAEHLVAAEELAAAKTVMSGLGVVNAPLAVLATT